MTSWIEAAFTKHYPGISITGDFQWLDEPRRITALFGPSGCGKTTILRCLAGLERPDEGYIRAFGETWCDVNRRVHVAPQLRHVGFLFQDYMLFPHLNVRDNVCFGTRESGQQSDGIDRLMARLQLSGLEKRWPRELSGGQQQRVALARALAAQPRWLCLDEPLSALDTPTRTELRGALRDWLHQAALPALIVSHDSVEVQALADDVIVLHHGRILQTGTVAAVWHSPWNSTVARIVGYDNLLPAKMVATAGTLCAATIGHWRIQGRTNSRSGPGSAVHICVRAEDVRCHPLAEGADDSEGVGEYFSRTTVAVQELIPERGLWRLRLRHASGLSLQAIVNQEAVSTLGLRSGRQIQIELAPDSAMIVDAT